MTSKTSFEESVRQALTDLSSPNQEYGEKFEKEHHTILGVAPLSVRHLQKLSGALDRLSTDHKKILRSRCSTSQKKISAAIAVNEILRQHESLYYLMGAILNDTFSLDPEIHSSLVMLDEWKIAGVLKQNDPMDEIMQKFFGGDVQIFTMSSK